MLPTVIQALNNRNINVQIVLPDIIDKNHYKRKYNDRGNHQNWIDNMIKNWENHVDPQSPKFITNILDLQNPIKEPIILNTSCTDITKPFQPREYLSDIIKGNIRFKPKYLVSKLKKSLSEMDVKVEQHSFLKNIININYLFKQDADDEDKHYSHQITIDLTPLADTNASKAKENEVEIIFSHQHEASTVFDDFMPKFRYFEINSDEDIINLHDLITTLVVNDIQFTKTLKRLEFELLF